MEKLIDIPLLALLEHNFCTFHTGNFDFNDYTASHRVDFFIIVWFGATQGTHYIDFTPYPVKRNFVYLLSQNQVHAVPDGYPEAKVIAFSKDFFDSIEDGDLRFLFARYNNAGIFISEEKEEHLNRLFELMLLENTSNKDIRLLHAYISAFLINLHRINQNPITTATFQDKRLGNLFQLVSDNYKIQKLVGFYADKIGLTTKRLNQLLKEKTGTSVSQLIYSYTLIDAKRDICHSSKSLKEIAIELGFRDQSYFSRFFKKQTGSTPERFRLENI